MSDVLAIGPHPDDIELAMGGTVAGLTARGFEVVLLDLTRGEMATRGTPETRAVESARAAEILGATRECLDLPDGGVSARSPEHLQALVAALRRHRPRLVLGLHWHDDHPDHIEGGELVRRAVYVAGLQNYPAPGSPSHRPARVLFGMGRRSFEPSLVVAVDRVYGKKKEALEAYRSQFFRSPDDPLATPISDPGFLDRVEARDRTYGGMIGVSHGEPFYEPGPVPVRDPGSLVEGNTP